jgi:hypothetical protein
LIEQGLDIELANWRAVVAPPDLSAAQREALIGMLEQMVRSPSWQQTLIRLGWTDAYLAGPPFAEFLDAERVRVARIVSRLRGTSGSADAAGVVGEWIFPLLVLGGTAIAVVALLIRGRESSPARSANTPAVLRVILGLMCFAALLNLAGFVAAGTVLFAATASAFGSGRLLRDALLGLALCAAVYVTFTYGLAIQLP